MPINVTGGSLEFVAAINDSDFGKTIQRMEQQLKSLSQTAQAETRSIDGIFQKAAGAIATYLSFNAATDFAKQIIDVRSQFQSLEISFNTMLKSKERATALMADIVKLAATTPFTLQEVGTGAKQLLAFGTSAGDVVSTLKTLGDVAAGVGAPIGDLVYLYGTLQTQGRAYTRDILQFTSRGIPIIDELAKQFGVTKDKVQELVEAGKVGFPQVEAAFKSLTGAGGSFFNLMEQQSHTLNGMISNLKDAFSQMLNDIGKSQEGILGNSIQGLTTLVKNYQSVLDILKVIVITYGSYRAALLATAAIQTGLNAEQLLYAGYVQLTAKAQLALNAVMLAMPTIAITAGIAALGIALFSMATTSDAAADALNKIKDIQVQAAQAAATEKAKIDELLISYNDRTKSDEEHATALKKIIDLNPKMLSGLNANNISTQQGQVIIDKYLISLENKAIAEAAYAAKLANTLKIVELQTKGFASLDPSEKLGRSLQRFFLAKKDLSRADEEKGIVADLVKSYEVANQKITEATKKRIEGASNDGTTPPGPPKAEVRSLAVIEAEIKGKKEKQLAESASSEQFMKYQRQINALEKEAQAIRGKSAGQLKAINAEETRTLAINEKKKTLLNDIEALHREAAQSGLPKEASEVDKINEKYDIALRKISEFNKKYPKNKITTVEIQQLGNDRLTEVANAKLRKDAEDYKKHLEEQKDVFTQYQEAIKTIGIDKANQMFAGQTKGFDTYLEYLQAEHDKLIAELAGGRDIGLDAKLKANADLQVEAQKAATKVAYDEFAKVLSATQTFADKRKAIEVQYAKDVATIEKEVKGDEKDRRLQTLKEVRDKDLTDLENNLARQSSLYKKLNEDIIRYTREQLKQRKKDLKEILNKGEYFDKDKQAILPITPAMIADINSALGTTNALLHDTKKIAGLTQDEFKKIIDYTAIAGSAFSTLGDAFEPLNQGLSKSLKEMGEIAGIAGNVVKGIATGDPMAIVAAVAGIIKIFAEAKQSRIAAQKDLEAFQLAQFTGELEINSTYRERLRLQKNINDLKLDGLKKETDILNSQKGQVEDQYKKILALIQQQSFVSGTHTEKDRLFGLLLTGQTNTVKEFSGLAGKTYEDLEKLFLSGQLDEKAKALFQQLEKLKKEGIDIDAALEENKKKAAEIFTGTTSDAILDSIVKGFADGKRATADFADNFQDLMKNAILNSLKYQALEKPLKDFYDSFAAASESDNQLSLSEIDALQSAYNKIITDAGTKFDQLQKLTNVSFGAGGVGQQNSLQGAIKGITEDTAQLLAGQFGGMRLTAIQALNIAQSSLNTLNKIENNTSLIKDLVDYNRKFDTLGIKLRA